MQKLAFPVERKSTSCID